MSTWKKLGLLGALYLTQGLPYGFFTQALPVLLRKQGLSLGAVGLASLLALPWALKFLWAPLVDRHHWPALGPRRSWILPLQGLTVLLLFALAFYVPSEALLPLFAAVLLANLLAATQDIATDGLAVDLLLPEERGPANGVQVGGYRVGMIIGGGALLLFFERAGWAATFVAMAALVLVASVPVLLHRERSAAVAPAAAAPSPHFLRRPDVLPVLGLALTFKAGEALATGMLRPFLADRGLSLGDIGLLLGTTGFVGGLVGALVGGALVPVLGRRRAILGFGVLQALAILGYVVAAAGELPLLALHAICGAEHFASGMATAALFTVMMDRCREGSAASDYTVQASAVVIATGSAAALSGFSAQALGYELHFVIAAGLALAAVPLAAHLYPGGADAPAAAMAALGEEAR